MIAYIQRLSKYVRIRGGYLVTGTFTFEAVIFLVMELILRLVLVRELSATSKPP